MEKTHSPEQIIDILRTVKKETFLRRMTVGANASSTYVCSGGEADEKVGLVSSDSAAYRQ